MRSGSLLPPGGELIEPLLGWPIPIAGRWSRRVRINVRFSRRGRRVLEPGRLVIRDPLRLFSRELVDSGGEEVLVLPRIEPVTAPGGGGAGAGEQGGRGLDPGVMGRRLDASLAELEIDGLRPYREGAPASRIHWPTVARRGEMLERRLVAELDSAPLVVLDPSAPASEEALDSAVRAPASICLWLARKDGCAVLLPGDRRPIDLGHDLGAWPAVHARLALVEEGAAPGSGELGPRGGAVIWVTGADLRATPRALERLPAAAPRPRCSRLARQAQSRATRWRCGSWPSGRWPRSPPATGACSRRRRRSGAPCWCCWSPRAARRYWPSWAAHRFRVTRFTRSPRRPASRRSCWA